MSEYAAWQEWLAAQDQDGLLPEDAPSRWATRRAFHAGWTARSSRRGDLLAAGAGAIVLAVLMTILLTLTAMWW
jgi:hypothetical protein